MPIILGRWERPGGKLTEQLMCRRTEQARTTALKSFFYLRLDSNQLVGWSCLGCKGLPKSKADLVTNSAKIENGSLRRMLNKRGITPSIGSQQACSIAGQRDLTGRLRFFMGRFSRSSCCCRRSRNHRRCKWSLPFNRTTAKPDACLDACGILSVISGPFGGPQ
jgi:hypothetical protein